MDPLSYFETVTSKSALNRHKYPPLHQRNILPAASVWDRRELFESRVFVGGSRHNVLFSLSSPFFKLMTRSLSVLAVVTPWPSSSP